MDSAKHSNLEFTGVFYFEVKNIKDLTDTILLPVQKIIKPKIFIRKIFFKEYC